MEPVDEECHSFQLLDGEYVRVLDYDPKESISRQFGGTQLGFVQVKEVDSSNSALNTPPASPAFSRRETMNPDSLNNSCDNVGVSSATNSPSSARQRRARDLKPKDITRKGSVSSISKVVTASLLMDEAKSLPAKSARNVDYMIYNTEKSVCVVDREVFPGKILQQLHFHEGVTSHDVNLMTRSSKLLDILVSLRSGELVLHDSIDQRPMFFNKVDSIPAMVAYSLSYPRLESSHIIQNGHLCALVARIRHRVCCFLRGWLVGLFSQRPRRSFGRFEHRGQYGRRACDS